LSPEQLAAGESRKFFINDVSDGKPPMTVKTKLQKPISMELIFHDHDDSKQIVSRDISFRPSDTVETVVRVVKESFIAGLKLDSELELEKGGKSLESAKTLAEALWGEKGL
jgi:hypothetical protein